MHKAQKKKKNVFLLKYILNAKIKIHQNLKKYKGHYAERNAFQKVNIVANKKIEIHF